MEYRLIYLIFKFLNVFEIPYKYINDIYINKYIIIIIKTAIIYNQFYEHDILYTRYSYLICNIHRNSLLNLYHNQKVPKKCNAILNAIRECFTNTIVYTVHSYTVW